MRNKMKKAWYAAFIVPVALAAVLLLLAHGDEQVSGVVLADEPVEQIAVLDGIKSSKGKKLNGFSGALYATSTAEYGKYTVTQIAPVPRSKDLYASVYFIASPEGMEYTAQWMRAGQSISKQTRIITSDAHQQAVSFMLGADLTQPGDYTLEIYYAGDSEHPLYSQNFTVG